MWFDHIQQIVFRAHQTLRVATLRPGVIYVIYCAYTFRLQEDSSNLSVHWHQVPQVFGAEPRRNVTQVDDTWNTLPVWTGSHPFLFVRLLLLYPGTICIVIVLLLLLLLLLLSLSRSLHLLFLLFSSLHLSVISRNIFLQMTDWQMYVDRSDSWLRDVNMFMTNVRHICYWHLLLKQTDYRSVYCATTGNIFKS